MESIQERLAKLKEERIAREKARLEKLRELNLKKYNKTDSFPIISKTRPANELKKTNSITRIKDNSAPVKNNFHVNGTTKRPITAPPLKTVKKSSQDIKKNESPKSKNEGTTAKHIVKDSQDHKMSRTSIMPKDGDIKTDKGPPKTGNIPAKLPAKPIQSKVVKFPVQNNNLPGPSGSSRVLKEIKPKSDVKVDLSKFALKNSMRKSLIPFSKPAEKPKLTRKSMVTKMDCKESVFDRLYKPKYEPKQTQNDVEKIHKDPAYLKKVIKSSGFILPGNLCKLPVRRSISAVHFKRVNKSELANCIHKCSSVGDKLNKVHLENDISEEEQVTSAIKSERKKVKFMTPMPFNTPRPEELQYRLKTWLQKRGKSLDSYHHLQCFGLHHLSSKNNDYLLRNFDEENKENVALDSDSDDGSYNENMNRDQEKVIVEDLNDFNKWRRVSSVSESVDFDDSRQLDETLTSQETANDDLVTGALTDLAELTREGFDWKQSARWLRAIKDRYPQVTGSAAYWECKAVLEESRGEPFASLHCWEEAIAKGTEQKVAEANLDHLLDKFIQLKINPNSGTEKQSDSKQLVDMNNIFKSSVIRFTITQAKQRQTQTPLVCVTPVRRSGRLSVCPNSKQKVCENMRQVAKLAPFHQFTPNKNLVASP